MAHSEQVLHGLCPRQQASTLERPASARGMRRAVETSYRHYVVADLASHPSSDPARTHARQFERCSFVAALPLKRPPDARPSTAAVGQPGPRTTPGRTVPLSGRLRYLASPILASPDFCSESPADRSGSQRVGSPRATKMASQLLRFVQGGYADGLGRLQSAVGRLLSPARRSLLPTTFLIVRPTGTSGCRSRRTRRCSQGRPAPRACRGCSTRAG